MKRKILLIIVPMVFLIAAFTPCYADLVTNGGFETGDFTGWYTAAASSGSWFGVDWSPHSGDHNAYFGATDYYYDYIWQWLTVTPGQSYTLNFWLQNNGTGSNSFAAWLDGYVLELNNAAVFDYTQYTYTVTATSTLMGLEFHAYNLPGWYFLDDVSVNPVPEPASMLLLGLGLIGLAVYRKKFKG